MLNLLELATKNLFRIGIILIGFTTTIFLFNSFLNSWGQDESAIWGQYGDFVGGVVGTTFSIIGVLLLVVTLKEQRNAFSKQQIENRFYELLQLHRNNVSETVFKPLTGDTISGRDVFVYIFNSFHTTLTNVRRAYPFSKSNKNEHEWATVTIRITYLITFFGVNDFTSDYLKSEIGQILSSENKKMKDKLINDITINEILKIDFGSEDSSNPDDVSPNLIGHQSRLGHYFRHLFQTVKYINKQPASLLTYDEKYDYIKTLRAQMSTHEQALFLYNAISGLGYAWEEDPEEKYDENYKLITKYNFIKNIPLGFTKDLNPKDYFPDIDYEFDKETPKNRKNLIKIYKKMKG